MKATINKAAKTKFTTSHRKEGKCFLTVYAAIVGDKVPVELRIYYTGTKAYACIWINDNNTETYLSGSGSAGGYGYDKRSAAADEAIRNAGVTISESINARGESAIYAAMSAIATELGYNNTFIFKTNQ